jgi:hypothetical protein
MSVPGCQPAALTEMTVGSTIVAARIGAKRIQASVPPTWRHEGYWMPDMRTKFVEANGLRFEVLEQGTGDTPPRHRGRHRVGDRRRRQALETERLPSRWWRTRKPARAIGL